MTISRVATRGFGTFSDINELPVRGFTIGAVAAAVGPGRITVGAAVLRGIVHGNAVLAGLQVGASLNNGVHAGAAVR